VFTLLESLSHMMDDNKIIMIGQSAVFDTSIVFFVF